MNVLVFNCGSSSLSYKIYRTQAGGDPLCFVAGKGYHVASQTQENAFFTHKVDGEVLRQACPLPDHAAAAKVILDFTRQHEIRIDAIGHRFVHGGERFTRSVKISASILSDLEACRSLAPIHNPNTLSVINLCRQEFPDLFQYAVFDTAFHAAMPEKAYRYAIARRLSERYGYRKFGFHGLSYQYVRKAAAGYLGIREDTIRLVACHLGTGGSSAAAIQGFTSLDTSMGYSPLPGLIMSTRCGDIDPAIILDLIEQQGISPAEVNKILNKESGLVGVSQFSSDLFEIIEKSGRPDGEQARLALEMVAHRLKQYIGAYLALLGGADALVFTDDIGVRAWQLRALACANLSYCGLVLDEHANQNAPVDKIASLNAPESKIRILVIPTDEELVIAREGQALLFDDGS